MKYYFSGCLCYVSCNCTFSSQKRGSSVPTVCVFNFSVFTLAEFVKTQIRTFFLKDESLVSQSVTGQAFHNHLCNLWFYQMMKRKMQTSVAKSESNKPWIKTFQIPNYITLPSWALAPLSRQEGNSCRWQWERTWRWMQILLTLSRRHLTPAEPLTFGRLAHVIISCQAWMVGFNFSFFLFWY